MKQVSSKGSFRWEGVERERGSKWEGGKWKKGMKRTWPQREHFGTFNYLDYLLSQVWAFTWP